MSPLHWLQNLFTPKEQSDDPNVLPDLEDSEPFVFSQHLRIILAILFAVFSAGILWWIMT